MNLRIPTLLATAALTLAAQSALAASVTFNLGGNGGVDASSPSQYQFSQSGLSLTATPGYSSDGGATLVETFSNSGPMIAQWSPGLGVYNTCNNSCDGGSGDDQHTVDNAPRSGSSNDAKDDFIRLTFGANVRVTGIQLSCLGCDLNNTDWDISYRVGNGAWASRQSGTSSVSSGVATYLFNGADTLTSNSTFLIAAKFGDNDDSFKVSAITVETSVPTQTGSVPLPGTLALLGASLFGLGLSRRQKRA